MSLLQRKKRHRRAMTRRNEEDMEKPAMCGGNPVRESKLYYGHQYLDDADYEAVLSVLKSDYLTCGPKITQLEEKLCKITGAKYAVACSNGTAALHIAALAAGITKGDEVITTPITFAASANCVFYCGGRPVFADIDDKTYNIDPDSVKECITERTKAVIAVDFTGQAADLDRLREICREHHLILIEDAAHSIGTTYGGIPVGAIADMTTFSFHPVKTVTGGEGGAVLTNNKEYYQKLLLYRSHGITRDSSFLKKECEGPWYYEMLDLGYNYRMTDIQAGLLVSQLDKLPKFQARRKELVKKYDDAFSRMDTVIIQEEIPRSDTTRHLYILRLRLDKLSIGRRAFFDAMQAENICCNVHYIPVYFFPFYEERGYKKGICPKAESLYEEIITLPLYYAMSDQDCEDVIRAVQKITEYYRK